VLYLECSAAATRIVWCHSETLQCCTAGGVPLDILRAAIAKAAERLPAQLEAVESALKQVNAQLEASCLILHPWNCAAGFCRPVVKGTKFSALKHYCECLLIQCEAVRVCVKPCMLQADAGTSALCQPSLRRIILSHKYPPCDGMIHMGITHAGRVQGPVFSSFGGGSRTTCGVSSGPRSRVWRLTVPYQKLSLGPHMSVA
jgi:hypothetical protein